MEKLSRRTLMTALAGTGVWLGAAPPVLAFSQEAASGRALALHEKACGATASHKELVAEVERVLGSGYSEAEKRQVVSALSCPICGCPLSGLF